MSRNQLAEWIRGHGFAVRTPGWSSGVEVGIPWSDTMGRSGIDWVTVYSFDDAQRVLGY